MKTPDALREGMARFAHMLSAAGLFAGLLSSLPVAAQPGPGQLSPQELKLRADWRTALAQVPLPKAGCFQAAYPDKQWQAVACKPAPNIPMPPKIGARPLVVGNGDDVSAQAPTGFISTGIGTFDSVTGVTSESGPIGNTGPAVANAYTLQLNTNTFASTACSGAAVPSACSGWEQFVFFNDGANGAAFIQYWLLNYNTTCPAGWNQFSFTGSTTIYCWKNDSGGAVAVPNQPIGNLAVLSLTGVVSATSDSVTFASGGTAYARTGDNAVAAAAGWQIAEFNVFGAGGSAAGGGAATFNSGSTIVPRTRIIYGGTAAPGCVAVGFTGEKNNLSFGPSPPTASAPGPAVIFTESSAGGATSNCGAAVEVGDTHITTFAGLFYDFQASGDFVLLQSNPGFVVQTRKVSGAPTWPNASVNHAVATQMGKDTIALCLAPTRLIVNGKTVEISERGPYSTPDGVDIWRRGNQFFILGQSGDSVRATDNSTWMDIQVGLGHWPAKITGLLANANNNVNNIATRGGAVLTRPFPFDAFYRQYGESWRVGPEESLLSVCGDRRAERGIPSRPFYASDLPAELATRARAVCLAAGVKEETQLDACTLDVAVIGDNQAAQVYVGMPAPVVEGKIISTNKPPGHLKWWLLLALLLLILLLWLFLRRR
jgi:hypothetical protein